jgi:hypothetical protein
MQKTSPSHGLVFFFGQKKLPEESSGSLLYQIMNLSHRKSFKNFIRFH